MHPPRRRRERCLAGLLQALALVVVASSPMWAQSPPVAQPTRSPSLGLTVDPGETPPATGRSVNRHAPRALLAARWGSIEIAPGEYDWHDVLGRLDALKQAGFAPVIVLEGPPPTHVGLNGLPGPDSVEGLAAWLAFARSAVRTCGHAVDALQVGRRVDGDAVDFDAASYAYFLKQSVVALRAEGQLRSIPLRIVQATFDLGEIETQRELWRRDVAAYLDAIAVQLPGAAADDDLDAAIDSLFEEVVRFPPASEVWILTAPISEVDPWLPVEQAIRVLTRGADVAVLPARSLDIDGAPELLWALQDRLAEGYAPAPLGGAVLQRGEREGGLWGTVLGRFFTERDFSSALIYRAREGCPEADLRLSLDSAFIRDVQWIDVAGGVPRRLVARERRDGRSGREIVVPCSTAPQLLSFRQPAPQAGLDLAPEELGVAARRGLTAEEIIARHQEVQRVQDDRLQRWTARGAVDLRYKLAPSGTTFEVRIESNYFWEREGVLEWEQTDYWVNGNRLTWKKIPELPLIQPEKVLTLPLDLTLDRTYVYRLSGEETVGDRPAYLLEFEPNDPTAASRLYRGRVWIDREHFVRLKATVVQPNSKPPVLSAEHIEYWAPQTGPDGQSYWLLQRVDGEQVWNTFGRTFVVRREVRFDQWRINPSAADFESLRQAAYASSNQMLRDTDRGYRYLERTGDGSRAVKEGVDSSQWFLAGGIFKDASTDGALPLAGVNWLDYDLGGRNIQVNALFAGILGVVTASKPDLFDRRIDGTADLALFALPFDDTVYQGDDEVVVEGLRTRSQFLGLRLGTPIGQFGKVTAVAHAGLRQYFQEDDARRARASYNDAEGAELRFVLPEDHVETGAGLELTFNRRGFSLGLNGEYSWRSASAPWGLFDESTGEFGRFDLTSDSFVPGGNEPVRGRFARWGLTGSKEWHLPRFQRVRAEVNHLDGSRLDRFSRYQFGLFGEDRLDGFAGSGVRFDTGTIGRIGYAFNLLEVVRFDLALARAAVRDEARDSGRQAFMGVGFSGNFIGPWRTVISAQYGRAIRADIADLEGQQEFLVLVLKLF